VKDQIKVANRSIAVAEAKLARIDSEQTKLAERRDAAQREAAELRARAGQAAALAVIGDDSEDDKGALDHEAHAAELRATELSRTIAGLDSFRASTEAALRAARAERKQAVLAAIDEHVEGVVAEYVAHANTLVADVRRLLALDRIRGSLGDRRTVINLRDLEIPAPANFDGPRTGVASDKLYRVIDDHYANGENAPLAVAVEVELDRLAAQGVEV
jgi:hypothetical protein